MNIPAKIHYADGTQEDCVIYRAEKEKSYFLFRADKKHFEFRHWIEEDALGMFLPDHGFFEFYIDEYGRILEKRRYDILYVRLEEGMTLAMVEPELKPCPFCGGEAATSFQTTDPENKFEFGWIGCQKCKCFINYINNAKGLKEATEAWNRRADNG